MISIQKGKFYTLPITSIRDEGCNSFFIVESNGKEYAIRMFSFQKNDPQIRALKELPCMAKDAHGDNIVFVQNFARMFADRYIAGKIYPFVVSREVYNPVAEYRYYDVRDEYGVAFRLKCEKETLLVHNQKIRCIVSRPNQNKINLTLENENTDVIVNCICPKDLCQKAGIGEAETRFIISNFEHSARFEEARQHLAQGNADWIIKAVTAVAEVESWPRLCERNKERLLSCFHNMCLYLLEDSDYLLQFSESKRVNYQEWIAEKVSYAETYLHCLSLIKNGGCSEEIDIILNKIRKSGYIYHPHRRMQLLIAMFSMQPRLLEEKIDNILDLVAECAKDWKQPFFNDAFSSFLKFFIHSNREKTNRFAVVDDEQGRTLLNRMVRSICFLLLMTEGKDGNCQLYKSMLFHYLSFIKSRSVLGNSEVKHSLSETLVEKAFSTLLLSEENNLDFTWTRDLSNTEFFAHQMANVNTVNTTFLTRSYENNNVRFTVSADGITLSSSMSRSNEKNVLPPDFPGWHNLQIFLNLPGKYTKAVSLQPKNIHVWEQFWNKVETTLFEDKKVSKTNKARKLTPEVGTEVFVRVLWKDESNPYRYFCRIEDPVYEGEGWIDTYQKGGSLGLFHFDPMLDIDSFYMDGRPMLFKVRVNSIGSPKKEVRTYTFDAISFIDNLIREQADYGEESDCKIFHVDKRNYVFCGVSSYGYGIFMPITEENVHYGIGDTVRVRLTDGSRPNTMQGEILGDAETEVDVKEATTKVLRDYCEYCGGNLYEETEDELEEEAMSVSEDLFEGEYMTEIINIFDHKAVLESDNVKSYAYLSIAHILSRLIGDATMMHYLAQRQHFLCILEDYGTNGRVNDEELENLGERNSDMVENFPLLKQRLTEMRIVNCFGQPERNKFLWDTCNAFDSNHILAKLSRLMLSYNMAEGFGLQEQQQTIIDKIKSLLNVNVELPKIYSFGEEDQLKEFKTSIVFPPNNNMREDIKQQTFNVMKVVCGMVNSYGGTLYLGVYDTGTAKGLEDDLKFFDGSVDKFDLYVRNSIRNSLGDQVNASITVDRPEAGKHYVYAIHIVPSKSPVILRWDNKFYLREGTSTYPIDLPRLIEIMEERNFANYGTSAVGIDDQSVVEPVGDEGKKEKKTVKARVLVDNIIATSMQRPNVTENWKEGYGIDTNCFLRIKSIGDWCVLDDVEWEDGLLTLAIHNNEADGYIIIVYEDGKVNKVPVSQLVDKTRNRTYKMFAHKKPIFISPAKKDDALLTVYEDGRENQNLRLDDVMTMEDGKMLSAGFTLTDVEFRRITYCEVVDKQYHEDLNRMHNLKRTKIGVQVRPDYDKREIEILTQLGFYSID